MIESISYAYVLNKQLVDYSCNHENTLSIERIRLYTSIELDSKWLVWSWFESTNEFLEDNFRKLTPRYFFSFLPQVIKLVDTAGDYFPVFLLATRKKS